MEIFLDFFDWMAALPPMWIYTTILVIAYLENVVPPIPGDMVIVFGGYLVGVGLLNFTTVFILATVGGALGFMTMYALGFRIGYAVLDPVRLRWLPKRHIYKAQRWLHRWGYGVVLANRFLSGTRSVISLSVGMMHMKPAKVFLFASISAAVWTALITYMGFVVGDNWPVIGEYLGIYGKFVLIGVLLLAGVLGMRYFWRKKRRQTAKGTTHTGVGSVDRRVRKG